MRHRDQQGVTGQVAFDYAVNTAVLLGMVDWLCFQQAGILVPALAHASTTAASDHLKDAIDRQVSREAVEGSPAPSCVDHVLGLIAGSPQVVVYPEPQLLHSRERQDTGVVTCRDVHRGVARITGLGCIACGLTTGTLPAISVGMGCLCLAARKDAEQAVEAGVDREPVARLMQVMARQPKPLFPTQQLHHD